jgi:hypothetical protein
MNDRDVLKRASEALRESTEPSPAELAALRARVLSNKVTPLARRSRSKSLRWLLPLAAALVTGSALAATPGAWQGLVDAVERYLPVELLSPAREATHPARKRTHKPPAPPPSVTEPAASAAPVEPTPLVEAPGAPAPATQAPSAGAGPRAVARAPSPRSTSPVSDPAPVAAPEPAPQAEPQPAGLPPAPSAELALYRPAHELHFRARNYAAALSAWDAYLSRFPAGTLALEAEYNRALCLMRLRRYAEARSALAPFAGGARGGGYRRSEATRFLEALEKVP